MTQQRKIIDIGIGSDLYVAGKTEDGQDYIAENYFVTVELDGGEVLRHERTFLGCKVESGVEMCEDVEDYGWDYGPYFRDVREESQAEVERLKGRVEAAIAAGKALNLSHWYHYRNVYGSGAYLEEVACMTKEQRAQ